MAKNIIKSLFKEIKNKNCKECGGLFKPFTSLQVCCSQECAIDLSKKRVWKAEKQKIIDKTRTRTEWLNLAQVVFNTYIRLRDKDKGCITCSKPFRDKYDAGHFFSVGSYPALRFNEDNVQGQCVACNQHGHGMQSEYFIQLPKRIGLDRFNVLLEQRKSVLKLSEVEIKELINVYKKKIKELKK
jgi:hypothetical protein